MIKRLKLQLNNKGLSLIELIVAMLVMVTIMIAVTTVFAPMLQTYQRANNLAEVNTLMDNISQLIMNDIASAHEVFETGRTGTPTITSPAGLTLMFSLRTTHFIDYYLDTVGTIWIDTRGAGEPERMLPLHYYRYWGDGNVFRVNDATFLNNDNGVVTLTLFIDNINDGWSRTRIYTARPVTLE